MTLRISTVDSTIYINDLGLVLEHPTTDRDLSLEFTSDELRQSTDLTTAIQNGDLTVDDGTFAIDGSDYDPHIALSQELQLHLDSRFISHAELSAGYHNIPIKDGVFPLSLNSTAASTRNIYTPAARWGTWQISAGDVVVIAGSTAADGSYTVESVSDHQNFIVVESIADSTGGTISVYHPSAAGLIGVDDTNFNNISGVVLQDVLDVIDSKLNTVVDDDKVLASSTDITPGFLYDKLVAGSGLDITLQNTGGNESLILTNTISGITIENEGIELTNSPNYTLDFVGDGVDVVASGNNTARITISGDDRKIKVTDNDAVPDFICDKIVTGPGLSINHLNDGGNELLEICANAGEFGTDFWTEYEEGISSTTANIWQDKITLTVSGLVAGYYYILWSAESSMQVSNLESHLRLQYNNISNISETETHFHAGGIWMTSVGARILYLTAGDHFFDLDFRSSQSGKTCSVRNTSIIFWRVV